MILLFIFLSADRKYDSFTMHLFQLSDSIANDVHISQVFTFTASGKSDKVSFQSDCQRLGTIQDFCISGSFFPGVVEKILPLI